MKCQPSKVELLTVDFNNGIINKNLTDHSRTPYRRLQFPLEILPKTNQKLCFIPSEIDRRILIDTKPTKTQVKKGTSGRKRTR